MIKQRSSTDCGIATLANALSITYEQALQLYNRNSPTDNPGVTMQETCAALYKAGYNPIYIPLSGFPRASGMPESITIPTHTIIQSKKPAILQVTTISGLIHQVYFDGKDIYDPSPRYPSPLSISDYPSVVDCVFVSKRRAVVVVRKGVFGLRVWMIRAEIAGRKAALRFVRVVKREMGYLADWLSGK